MCYGYLNIWFHNFLLSIHMKTQIIKLDSLKVNLKETFNKLIKKYSQKNAEITLIVK